MSRTRLFRLPLDPDEVDRVREYFETLETDRETFERGLALEGMNAEAAWLDESQPALYYMHDEGETYPREIDPESLDERLRAVSERQSEFFRTVAAGEFEGREDLTELTELFAASADTGSRSATDDPDSPR